MEVVPNEYLCSGLDAVNLKIVRDVEGLYDDQGYFKPDMCHQVFGNSETVYGYTDLKIQIVYEASQFFCYVKCAHASKVRDSNAVSSLKAEDYWDKLDPWLPMNYYIDKKPFVKKIGNPRAKEPRGKLITEFVQAGGREFQVRLADSNTDGYKMFHKRMETIIVWFIDAANYIDVEDTKWQFFTLYEKVSNKSSSVYYPLGYSTVYEYFAFPDNRRYRISQFIIFPPYQKLGLGTQLLRAIYQHLQELPNTLDITVEDPSDKFQAIRDYVDAKLCLTLPSFSPVAIKQDFNKNMIAEAKSKFKLNEKQIRRVYEIIRLKNVNVQVANDYASFKMLVKQRLNVPFKKQENAQKRMKLYHDVKSNPLGEIHRSDHRLNFLEKDYQKLVAQYHHVVRRLQLN